MIFFSFEAWSLFLSDLPWFSEYLLDFLVSTGFLPPSFLVSTGLLQNFRVSERCVDEPKGWRGVFQRLPATQMCVCVKFESPNHPKSRPGGLHQKCSSIPSLWSRLELSSRPKPTWIPTLNPPVLVVSYTFYHHFLRKDPIPPLPFCHHQGTIEFPVLPFCGDGSLDLIHWTSKITPILQRKKFIRTIHQNPSHFLGFKISTFSQGKYLFGVSDRNLSQVFCGR